MNGPMATPGIFVLFDSCKEHNPQDNSIKMFEGRVSSSVLNSPTAANCEHIHCKECGCIKSRTACFYTDVGGNDMSSWKKPSSHLSSMPSEPLPRSIGKLEENPNFPYDFEDVEPIYRGPEKVSFDIKWKDGDKSYFVTGELPPELATKVMDIINKP